jgi:serine/threonine-protein kinase RsbT
MTPVLDPRKPVSRPPPAAATSRVTLRAAADVAAARRAAGAAMDAIGASALKRTRFVTAVSEIARNAVIHGGGGAIVFRETADPRGRAVEAECRDRGSGIADLARALTDGYTTGSGLGLGLPGARRLVDLFDIASGPGGVVVRLGCRAR